MAVLNVSNLTKRYHLRRGDDSPVGGVQGVSIEAAKGDVLTLLGPSGCGKSTTLRCIAGLERPQAGHIEVDGRTVFSAEKKVFLPPHKRQLGMVFQSYAVWPHMTVFGNVAYPLKSKRGRTKPSADEVDRRVSQILELTQLKPFRDRQATALSGGQQQRLALARALVDSPSLLLLDEPLSNLDAQLRERMRFELQRLQRELEMTTVYVTHDQQEALSLSTQVAVMNDGRVEQIGSPTEIYDKPATEFVARFIGSANVINGRLVDDARPGQPCRVDCGDRLGIVHTVAWTVLEAGQRGAVSIRPERIRLRPLDQAQAHRSGVPNQWEGRVEASAFLGDSVDQIVSVKDLELRVRSPRSSGLPAGSPTLISVDPDGCVVVPAAPANAQELDEPEDGFLESSDAVA
jgi:iron(III) transport system ATP-binding protein